MTVSHERTAFSLCLGPLVLGSLFGFGCRREVPSSTSSEAAKPPAVSPRPAQPQPGGRSSGQEPRSARPRTEAQTTRQKPSQGQRSVKSFAVYTLSRGGGVPAEARAAQLAIQKLIETDRDLGRIVSVETTRIGLEGERRLCVIYKNNRDGARAFERARAIGKGVALVNLVAEPCVSSSSKTGKQGEKA